MAAKIESFRFSAEVTAKASSCIVCENNFKDDRTMRYHLSSSKKCSRVHEACLDVWARSDRVSFSGDCLSCNQPIDWNSTYSLRGKVLSALKSFGGQFLGVASVSLAARIFEEVIGVGVLAGHSGPLAALTVAGLEQMRPSWRDAEWGAPAFLSLMALPLFGYSGAGTWVVAAAFLKTIGLVERVALNRMSASRGPLIAGFAATAVSLYARGAAALADREVFLRCVGIGSNVAGLVGVLMNPLVGLAAAFRR